MIVRLSTKTKKRNKDPFDKDLIRKQMEIIQIIICSKLKKKGNEDPSTPLFNKFPTLPSSLATATTC